VSYRGTIGKLLEDRWGKLAEIRGVEVGVNEGVTSAYLLERFPLLRLDMIDTFSAVNPDYEATSDPLASRSRQEKYEAMVRASKLTSFAHRRRDIFVRQSPEAAEFYPDLFYDFVFVDANHELGAVLKDSWAWWPKVKPGGLLIWHDYGNDQGDWTRGVKMAVDRFVSEVGRTVDHSDDYVAWCSRAEAEVA